MGYLVLFNPRDPADGQARVGEERDERPRVRPADGRDLVIGIVVGKRVGDHKQPQVVTPCEQGSRQSIREIRNVRQRVADNGDAGAVAGRDEASGNRVVEPEIKGAGNEERLSSQTPNMVTIARGEAVTLPVLDDEGQGVQLATLWIENA